MAQVAKRIRKRIRRAGRGIDLATDLSATVVVNNASDRGTTLRPATTSARPRDVDHGKENA
ncbi:MAG: hypothetical protein ACJ77M_04600 [Thermoleophilaceae bacterium]